MAAARNVSAAARMTDRPWPLNRLASLPIVVVLPVPLTPTTRTHGRAAGHGRTRVPDEIAGDEERRQLGADGRLGSTGGTAAPGAIDELDGQRGADVARDERLLDVVP